MNFTLNRSSLSIYIFIISIGCIGLISCSDSPQENKEQVLATVKHDTTKDMFENNCAVCHGKDGTAAISGAANLQTSSISSDSIEHQIANGKGNMPPFKSVLKGEQIKKLAEYVKSLRK